jgi:hypothetical protein
MTFLVLRKYKQDHADRHGRWKESGSAIKERSFSGEGRGRKERALSSNGKASDLPTQE